jgi:sensor histidine kinase YesM
MTVFFTTAPEVPQGNRLPVFSQHQPGRFELGFIAYSLLVLLKSFLLVLTHLFFCNAIIYILLPAFQLKKKYWILIAGTLLVSILVIPMGYFLYSMVYPAIDKLFGLYLLKPDRFIVFRSIDASLVNAVKVTIVAVAIALLKQWWLKQKEKERLEKEKIIAEVQLLKAQIHPAFLFSTLNNIISHAEAASPKAPEMLIKLADILSYMLYECEAPKVKLENEIAMIREYMELEKIRQGERLEMTFRVQGNAGDQVITPLLLLPFIDNSLSYSNNELVEQAWVNLDISIDNNILSMKLINGRPPGVSSDTESDEESLANVRKRLQLLYPGNHEVKISAEHELLLVYLHLTLEQQTAGNTSLLEINKPSLSYAGI